MSQSRREFLTALVAVPIAATLPMPPPAPPCFPKAFDWIVESPPAGPFDVRMVRQRFDVAVGAWHAMREEAAADLRYVTGHTW